MNKYLLWKSWKVTFLFKTVDWFPFTLRIKAQPLGWAPRLSRALLRAIFPSLWGLQTVCHCFPWAKAPLISWPFPLPKLLTHPFPCQRWAQTQPRYHLLSFHISAQESLQNWSFFMTPWLFFSVIQYLYSSFRSLLKISKICQSVSLPT